MSYRNDGEKMKYCDLHNHSVFSDGGDTPAELINIAKGKGLGAIALTDHNTISGLAEMQQASIGSGIDVILGSELTCEYKGKEIHMLCMFIDLNRTQGIEKYIKSIRKIKRERNIELAEKLRADGYEIDFFELERTYGSNINRAHFAKRLVELGKVESVDVAFKTILAEGGRYYNGSTRPCALRTASDIVSWGCTAVMAHPLLSLDKTMLEEFLPLAKEKGLSAIEVYYPKFNDSEREYLKELASKHSLALSGGSDYHGSIKQGIEMGMASVPYSCYNNLLELNKEARKKAMHS